MCMLKRSPHGQKLVQRLEASEDHDCTEQAYGAMYQWARLNVFISMGGEADGAPEPFRARWKSVALPGPERLDQEAVEEWLCQLARLRSEMYEVDRCRSEGEDTEADDLYYRILRGIGTPRVVPVLRATTHV